MEKEETNVIEDLYTLRAGLSVISQQHDEGKQFLYNSDKCIEEILYKLGDSLPRIDYIHYDKDNPYETSVLREIAEGNLNADKATELKKTKEFYLNKAIRRQKLYLVAILTIIPVAVALLITFGYFGVSYLMKTHPLCYLFGILAVATLVAFIISLKKLRLNFRWNKKSINDMKSTIYKFNNFIQIYPQYLQNTNEIVQNQKMKLTSIVESCNNLFAVLQQQYNYILDVRDWENLDLVIFALETRRASDIKEALIYVDGEIRTQRIENALSQATAFICTSISKVEQAVTNGFKVISEKLDQQNALLSQINTGIQLSNALLAKNNVSSRQLMSDVEDIKNLLN